MEDEAQDISDDDEHATERFRIHSDERSGSGSRRWHRSVPSPDDKFSWSKLTQLFDAHAESAAARRELEQQRSDGDSRVIREQEKRVAHLQHVGISRLGKRQLARGWAAWAEQREELVLT